MSVRSILDGWHRLSSVPARDDLVRLVLVMTGAAVALVMVATAILVRDGSPLAWAPVLAVAGVLVAASSGLVLALQAEIRADEEAAPLPVETNWTLDHDRAA